MTAFSQQVHGSVTQTVTGTGAGAQTSQQLSLQPWRNKPASTDGTAVENPSTSAKTTITILGFMVASLKKLNALESVKSIVVRK